MQIVALHVVERDAKECGAWWKKPGRVEIN
jgi:hypothetical protein